MVLIKDLVKSPSQGKSSWLVGNGVGSELSTKEKRELEALLTP